MIDIAADQMAPATGNTFTSNQIIGNTVRTLSQADVYNCTQLHQRNTVAS